MIDLSKVQEASSVTRLNECSEEMDLLSAFDFGWFVWVGSVDCEFKDESSSFIHACPEDTGSIPDIRDVRSASERTFIWCDCESEIE